MVTAIVHSASARPLFEPINLASDEWHHETQLTIDQGYILVFKLIVVLVLMQFTGL